MHGMKDINRPKKKARATQDKLLSKYGRLRCRRPLTRKGKAVAKKTKFLVDEVRGKFYVRAWKDDRTTIAVQVWHGKKADGEPAGDWGMPAILGLDACVAQALLQTGPAKKKK